MFSNLTLAELNRADLKNADLNKADLRGAYLYQANLFRANLEGANLTGAYLQETLLDQTDLRKADLSKSFNVTCIQLASAITDQTTIFPSELKIQRASDNSFQCKKKAVNEEKKMQSYWKRFTLMRCLNRFNPFL